MWKMLNQSINQAINQAIYRSIDQSINQSINQSIKIEKNTDFLHIEITRKVEANWQTFTLPLSFSRAGMVEFHPVDWIVAKMSGQKHEPLTDSINADPPTVTVDPQQENLFLSSARPIDSSDKTPFIPRQQWIHDVPKKNSFNSYEWIKTIFYHLKQRLLLETASFVKRLASTDASV